MGSSEVMKPYQVAKEAGLDGLSELAELSEQSEQTLNQDPPRIKKETFTSFQYKPTIENLTKRPSLYQTSLRNINIKTHLKKIGQ